MRLEKIDGSVLFADEIIIAPNGDVYPCFIKLKTWICDPASEPALQALNLGDPAAMGITEGWSREMFASASVTRRPDGSDYANLCIGCDAFFEAKLGAVLRQRAHVRQLRLKNDLAFETATR